MSSHTWAGCICLIWIIWQDKLFGWSAQGFVEEWTELLSENRINFSEKFQYICKFQHTHFYHVNGNMYTETCSFQSSDNNLAVILQTIHRFLTLTSRPICIRCSFDLTWEDIHVAMQESVKAYYVQNVSSFRHSKVHHHHNQHVPPTKKTPHTQKLSTTTTPPAT